MIRIVAVHSGLSNFCRNIPLVILAIAILSGCSDRKNLSPMPTVSEKAKRDISAPINCNTAQQDIKTLEDEKASVGKQALSGVRSVLPFAAVAGILMGDYSGRVEVATGQYNRDIEAKIVEIRAVCGLS